MTNNPPQNHLCSITLLGNLVAKPDIRYQANPVIAVAELMIATNTKWFDKSSNQYREWTSYHTVKMIGDVVERALLYAEKGDIMLIQGHLVNSKKSDREIIHATYAHCYPKGYARSTNQFHGSGRIISAVKLVKTENSRQLAEVDLALNFLNFSSVTQEQQNISIIRKVHVWGKQAQHLAENANINDEIIVDGKLSYINNSSKSQMIDAQHVILQKANES